MERDGVSTLQESQANSLGASPGKGSFVTCDCLMKRQSKSNKGCF